jgi:hypothetical protein
MAPFSKTDVVFGAVTCVSSALLLIFHLQGKPDALGALIALPLLAPWFFFAVSLCRAFQDGIAVGEQHVRERATGSPWLSFGTFLGRRMCLWLPLWVIFVVCLQPWRIDFGLSLCVLIAGLIAGTFAGCFLWVPVCRKVWTLTLASLSTLGAGCAVLLVLSTLVIESLDMGGYMGLGYFVYAPMMTSGCLFLASIAAGVLAWSRGHKWFRLNGTQSGDRQS